MDIVPALELGKVYIMVTPICCKVDWFEAIIVNQSYQKDNAEKISAN